MAQKNGHSTLFVGARVGEKRDKSGSYAVVEVVVLEGDKAAVATLFTTPSVAQQAAASFAPLEAVTLDFDQRMTARGPRSELVGIRAAG